MSDIGRVSVVGLGKVGSCLAACLAERGFEVVAVDRDPRVVERVRRGEAPVVEPGLAELVARNAQRLAATTDTSAAVRDSDVTFVVGPTPSRGDGSFATDDIEAAARELGAAYTKREYHVFVLVSTVLPGDVEGIFVRALERASGRHAGVDFGVCYSPEFVALGEAIAGTLRPQLQVIGESDPRAGDILVRVYEQLNEVRPVLIRTNFVNAELAKIGLNAFITMKLTFANVLGQICEALPGSDVDVVTDAIGADPRIGRRYLKAGLGFGGPCFPRDDVAFGYVARSHGAPALLQEATHRINVMIPSRVVDAFKGRLPPPAQVAVLGLTFKPGTPVTTGSQGMEIARLLQREGYRLRVFDPFADESAYKELGDGVTIARDMDDALADARGVVIANALPGVSDLQILAQDPIVVVDCWRAATHLERSPNVRYVPMGRGPMPIGS